MAALNMGYLSDKRQRLILAGIVVGGHQKVIDHPTVLVEPSAKSSLNCISCSFSVHIAYCTGAVYILQYETYPGVLLSSGSFSRNLCPFSSKWEECQISVTLQWQDIRILCIPQHECSQMHFWVSSDTLFYSFELSGTLLIYSELWRRCEWHLNFRGWTWVPSLGALWALSSTQPLGGVEIAGVDLRATTSLAARSA